MSQSRHAQTIIAFAERLAAKTTGETAESVAKSRNWLDAEGNPTDEGRELVASLEDQKGTRSVFRQTD